MFLEIFFAVVSVIAFGLCITVMIDMILFFQKMKDVKTGMTGKQIQNVTGYKLQILKIDDAVYYARVTSKLKMFKFRLVFCNGKLINKQRD